MDGSLPKHKASSAKSHSLQVVLVLLLCLTTIGTIAATIAAYESSRIELRLIGNKVLDYSESGEFEEPGYYARHCVFARCHDLTKNVIVSAPDSDKIKSREVGQYEISYQLNYLGETYTDLREIIIRDVKPPELNLIGAENIGLYVGEPYVEPGYTASDTDDGELTDSVVIEGSVDTSQLGVYTLKYSVSDKAGNKAEKTRRVFVYNGSALTSEPIASFDDLRNYISNNGWDLSLGFKNFNKGTEYTIDPDRVFYGASLVKTLDALYIYDHFGGPRNWNERYLLINTINYSNNSAHMSLASSLGVENLRNYADSIGMKHHLRGSIFYGDVEYFCDTSVSDQMAEWTKLWELINNLENGQELADYFINGYYTTIGFYGAPRLGFKAGYYGAAHHESAFFYADSPYFLTILTQHGYRSGKEAIMHDISERVYLINQTL